MTLKTFTAASLARPAPQPAMAYTPSPATAYAPQPYVPVGPAGSIAQSPIGDVPRRAVARRPAGPASLQLSKAKLQNFFLWLTGASSGIVFLNASQIRARRLDWLAQRFVFMGAGSACDSYQGSSVVAPKPAKGHIRTLALY